MYYHIAKAFPTRYGLPPWVQHHTQYNHDIYVFPIPPKLVYPQAIHHYHLTIEVYMVWEGGSRQIEFRNQSSASYIYTRSTINDLRTCSISYQTPCMEYIFSLGWIIILWMTTQESSYHKQISFIWIQFFITTRTFTRRRVRRGCIIRRTRSTMINTIHTNHGLFLRALRGYVTI